MDLHVNGPFEMHRAAALFAESGRTCTAMVGWEAA